MDISKTRKNSVQVIHLNLCEINDASLRDNAKNESNCLSSLWLLIVF